MAVKIIAFVVAVSCMVGCSRHVVIDPSGVAALNSADWTVKSDPRKSTSEPAE